MRMISTKIPFARALAGVALVAAFLALSDHAIGAVYNAASMSRSDVGAAAALTSDGDTVIVPAGFADWTNCLYISNSITLQFAGPGQSIIQDDIAYVNGGNPGNTESVITLGSTNTNMLVRLTGLEIVKGTNGRPVGLFEKGAIQVCGGTCNARIDNCLFTNINNDTIYVYNSCPVIDHCSFYINQDSVHFLCIVHPNWAGGQYADGAYTTPAPIGTSNAVYIEDCNFTGHAPGASFCAVDAFEGAHYVFRYNKVTNTWITCHGTESTGFYRGTRSMEIYGNFAVNSNWDEFLEWRSGTGVIWSNTVSGYKSFGLLSHYRSSTSYQFWGGLTGTNIIDANSPANARGFATTMTATAGSAVQTVVVTNTLPVNAYLGWSAIDINRYPTNTYFGAVWSNSANTLYFLATGDGQPSFTPKPGDTLQFYQPAICGIDMTGTGLSGPLKRVASGTNAGFPLGPWPTNAVEPVYSWGNTLNGVDAGVGAQNKVIQPKVHYFNDTPMPGYVPFTYPHPLTSIGSLAPVPPLAPSNLRVASPQ